MVPWLYRSPYLKRHLDRFIHFCSVVDCVQQTDKESQRHTDLRPRYICRNRLAAASSTGVACWLRINYTHTHPFNGPLSRTTRVGRYQKDKTNLDFTKARDSEWQWNPLGYIQVCTLLQTDNHASTPPLSFLQAGCPSCRPTNSVKALKALRINYK